MEQKELESKASSNLECLKRESRKHHSTPAGRRPGSSWGLSRILHTVQQNWTWMLTFKSTLCALRLLSYYEYLILKKKKKWKRRKNPTGIWVRRPEFPLWGSPLPAHVTLDEPFSALSPHFFICKVAIPALLPAQGSLEHLKVRCVETVCKIEFHIERNAWLWGVLIIAEVGEKHMFCTHVYILGGVEKRQFCSHAEGEARRIGAIWAPLLGNTVVPSSNFWCQEPKSHKCSLLHSSSNYKGCFQILRPS